MRVSTLVLALTLAACADPVPDPAPRASSPPDVAVQPPTTLDPTPADTASGTPEAPEVIEEPTASAPPVQPPAPRTEPVPEPPVSDALLPRPRPMPPAVPVDDRARTEAAEAFWSAFRAAIRSGDQATLTAGLADVVTVGEVEYRRDSPQVRSVLEQIAENEHVRDAYVSAEDLVHGPDESAFSSVARVETPEGDVTQARISGAVREVAPGDWRLVRLRTDPVDG